MNKPLRDLERELKRDVDDIYKILDKKIGQLDEVREAIRFHDYKALQAVSIEMVGGSTKDR